jgi:hypothetical protein
MAILLKPIYDVEGKVVALGELAIDEEAQLPGPLAFPDGTVQLTAATGNGGGVIVQDVPPQDPKSGQVWFESDTGKNFIYYLNADGSGQWIESAQPVGPAGANAPGGTPIGTIAIWSGTAESVPLGWMPCDGQDGRPDLRDRFVIGSSVTYPIGSTGGSADATVVAHSHSVTDPTHTHDTAFTIGSGGSEAPNSWGDVGDSGGDDQRSTTRPAGALAAGTGISVDEAGVSGVGANLPPYYSLLYIIKVTGDLTDGPQGPVGPQGETGNTTTTIDSAPPAEPLEGEVWFESDSGNMYVWYINPTSGEGSWVNTGVLVGGAGAGGKMPMGTTEERPESPVTGQMRFNTTFDRLEVYGLSFWQILKYDKEAGPPQIGEARTTGTTSASVDYTAHADVGADGVVSHTAVASPGGLTATLSQSESGTITVEGLDPNTRYTFTVHSNNAVGAGASSAASNEVLTWSVPDTPTIGEATVSVTSISVPYTAPAYNGGQTITSYTAVAEPGGMTSTIETADSGTFTFTDVFEYGQAYTFTVYATNTSGNSASSAPSNSVTMNSKKLHNMSTGFEGYQADTGWSIDLVDGQYVATIGYWAAQSGPATPGELVMGNSSSPYSTWNEVGQVTLTDVGTMYPVRRENLFKLGWGEPGLVQFAGDGWQMAARRNADNTVTVFINSSYWGTGDDGTTITMINLRTSFFHVSGQDIFEYTFPI